MAAPTYTSDLLNAVSGVTAGTLNAAESTVGWSEATGTPSFGGGALVDETDYFIQNGGDPGCIAKNCGTGTPVGVGHVYNSAITVPKPGAFFIWVYMGAPNTIDTEANGGMQVLAGSSATAYKQYYVRGSNTYTYGGWLNFAVTTSIEMSAVGTVSVNATNGTYTRSTGSFLTDGFEPGMTIAARGFTNAGNNTTKIISTVSATVITVTSATGLVTETGNGDEGIRMCSSVSTTLPTLGTNSFHGAGVWIPGPNIASKGNPFGIDVVRYGRGLLQLSGGETSNYATFAGLATYNDEVSRRLGIFQSKDGTYLWKGLLRFGKTGVATASRARATNVATIVTGTAHAIQVGDTVTITGLGGTGYNGTWVVASVPSTTSFTYANTGTNETTAADTGGSVGEIVDFRDSNRAIFVDNTPWVQSAFNRIEVRHASSRVDWTGVSISSLGTRSKGEFEVVDNADVNFESCTFTDLSTFKFLSGSTVNSTIFRRCGAVSPTGMVANDCTFESSSDTTGAVLLTASSDITTSFQYCTFVGNTTAIKITTAGEYPFNGHTFTNNTTQVDYTGTATTKTITNATTVAGVSFTFTSAAHGYTTNQKIVVKSVVSSTGSYNNAANEYFTIASVTTDTFTVNTSQAAGTYTSGGIATIPCLITPSNGSNVLYTSCTASGGGYIVVDSPSVNLVFKNVVNGSEIRIIRASDMVELGGIESVTGNTWTFSHKLGGTLVNVYIHSLGYQWFGQQGYTLPSANADYNVFQVIDRQYTYGSVP